MELKVSAHEPAQSPSVSESNPDEKEISDDDDDDRNHKHRRRDDARSQSQERDAVEQVYTKPYKRGNKPFENGHSYRETGSQSSEAWKNNNYNPMDSKFEKRRAGFAQSSQGPLDLNQRIRGRGREPGLWNQPVPPGLFGGRGLPNVSNAYGANWGAFGLVPGMSNGGMDSLHPLGLQGAYRSINPSMNMGLGLARQRCRDFEEQGFCLRGDMCPMEHGVNRIVVEDVQSLSQFNLPVSLQNANMTGAPGAPTNSFKPSHGKSSKRGVGPNGHGSNDADFYDPDQPLWGDDSQASSALQSINQSNVKENGPMFDAGPSGDQRAGPLDSSDEHTVKSGVTPALMGRITGSKNKTEMKENMVSKSGPSVEKHNDPNSSLKMQSGNGKSARKPSQKAQCTLFVNGIPPQQNKRESLLSHFHKFGEVIDIYIPSNSERAFVQFSKREEAEAALMAPDAVMGNRFIKLFWGNRDNIPINGTHSGYNTMPQIPPRGMTVSSTLHNAKSTPTTTAVPVPVINGPKPPPPAQKKMENLEVLKEELRKKQEMLDQKRNDFKRKLDKLAKQATALKGEIEPAEQVAKKPKLGVVADSTKAATAISTDPETVLSSPGAQVIGNGNKSMESALPKSSKSTAMVALPETPILKPSLRPLVPIGTSVVTNPFKLDNRPTAFKIISVLPNDLANIAVLKEHFSPFGDLSKIELDDLEHVDDKNDPQTAKYSARVYFTTRHSAEKAFSSGKCWNGHNLQFSWLKSSNRSKDGESPVSSSKGISDASVGPVLKSKNHSKDGESPVSSSKGISDASAGAVAKVPNVDSQKPATSGDGDSKKVEQMNIEKEHTEPDESNHAS